MWNILKGNYFKRTEYEILGNENKPTLKHFNFACLNKSQRKKYACTKVLPYIKETFWLLLFLFFRNTDIRYCIWSPKIMWDKIILLFFTGGKTEAQKG